MIFVSPMHHISRRLISLHYLHRFSVWFGKGTCIFSEFWWNRLLIVEYHTVSLVDIIDGGHTRDATWNCRDRLEIELIFRVEIYLFALGATKLRSTDGIPVCTAYKRDFVLLETWLWRDRRQINHVSTAIQVFHRGYRLQLLWRPLFLFRQCRNQLELLNFQITQLDFLLLFLMFNSLLS